MDCLREATVDAVQLAGEVADGFAGAWNRHDMEAFGQLFHEDADFVNVVGLENARPGIHPASPQRHPCSCLQELHPPRCG